MLIVNINWEHFAIISTNDIMVLRDVFLSPKFEELLSDAEIYMSYDGWTVDDDGRLSYCDYFGLAERLLNSLDFGSNDSVEDSISGDNGVINIEIVNVVEDDYFIF